MHLWLQLSHTKQSMESAAHRSVQYVLFTAVAFSETVVLTFSGPKSEMH